MLFCVVILLMIFRQIGFLNAIKVPCNEIYLTQNGSSCYPCNPGYFKYSECPNNHEQDRCLRCPVGEYQSNCDDSFMCMPCRLHCRPGEIQVQNCSAISNIKCQCKDGTFEVPDFWKPNETTCKAHSDCKPGEGVEKRGTPYEDTVCVQCEEGVTYSDKNSLGSCKPCSVCNTTFVKRCTPTNDSVCNDQAVIKPLTTDSPPKTKKTKTDVIIAVSVLTFVVVVAAAASVGFLVYRRRRGRTNSDTEANTSTVNLSDTIRNNPAPEQNGIDLPGVSVNGNDSVKCKEHRGRTRLEHMQNGSSLDSTERESRPLQSKQTEVANNEKFDKRENCAFAMSSYNKCGAGSNDSNDISIDAQGVPPRNFSRPSENQCRSYRSAPKHGLMMFMPESEDESIRSSTKNGASLPSEQSERNGGRKAVRETPPSNHAIDNEEKVWMSVLYFLSRNMDFNNFRSFYRWLAVSTNADLARTKDVDINRALNENFNDLGESIYQLIVNWRQATSNASIQQIQDALKRAKLAQVHDKLADALEEYRKQKFPTERLLSSDAHVDHPQMEELKEQHSTQ